MQLTSKYRDSGVIHTNRGAETAVILNHFLHRPFTLLDRNDGALGNTEKNHGKATYQTG